MGSKAADKEMSFLAVVLLNFIEAANQGRFQHFLLSFCLAYFTLCCGRFIYLFFIHSLHFTLRHLVSKPDRKTPNSVHPFLFFPLPERELEDGAPASYLKMSPHPPGWPLPPLCLSGQCVYTGQTRSLQ